MVSKTQTFTKGAAWVGLLGLVLSGPAAAATQHPSGYANSGLAQLAEVLSERGWHTRPGEDGSLLFATAASGFTTPQTLAMTSATATVPTPTATGPTDAGASERDHAYGSRTASLATPSAEGWLTNLGSQLEARGWVVTRDMDGGLSFHRGQPGSSDRRVRGAPPGCGSCGHRAEGPGLALGTRATPEPAGLGRRTRHRRLPAALSENGGTDHRARPVIADRNRRGGSEDSDPASDGGSWLGDALGQRRGSLPQAAGATRPRKLAATPRAGSALDPSRNGCRKHRTRIPVRLPPHGSPWGHSMGASCGATTWRMLRNNSHAKRLTSSQVGNLGSSRGPIESFGSSQAAVGARFNPECRVSLVNPSGGSCRRTDSLLGDSLYCPGPPRSSNTPDRGTILDLSKRSRDRGSGAGQ